MKRTPLVRRKAIRRRRRASKYARRLRDGVFMRFVKTLLCSVEEEWPDPNTPPTPCSGVIEADHMGDRGLGQKCSDSETAPMCTGHHRERTDHTGSFKHLKREDVRAWRQRAIQRTQTLFAESGGEVIA